MYGIDIVLGDHHIGSDNITEGASGYFSACACDKDSNGGYLKDKCRAVTGLWDNRELALFVSSLAGRYDDALESISRVGEGKVYFIYETPDSQRVGERPSAFNIVTEEYYLTADQDDYHTYPAGLARDSIAEILAKDQQDVSVRFFVKLSDSSPLEEVDTIGEDLENIPPRGDVSTPSPEGSGSDEMQDRESQAVDSDTGHPASVSIPEDASMREEERVEEDGESVPDNAESLKAQAEVSTSDSGDRKEPEEREVVSPGAMGSQLESHEQSSPGTSQADVSIGESEHSDAVPGIVRAESVLSVQLEDNEKEKAELETASKGDSAEEEEDSLREGKTLVPDSETLRVGVSEPGSAGLPDNLDDTVLQRDNGVSDSEAEETLRGEDSEVDAGGSDELDGMSEEDALDSLVEGL